MRLTKTAAELETIRTVAFFPLLKYNAKTGEFSGVLATERPDRAGEILDYEKSKPYFKAWVEASKKASGGKSLGPLREMHSSASAAGKLTSVTFDDQGKRILVKGKIVDPIAREKAEEGVYTGLSVGGDYLGDPIPDPADPRKVRYVAKPSEASLADIPCNPDATFELVGTDGLTKAVKFAPPPPEVIEAFDEPDVTSMTARAFAAVGGAPRAPLMKTLARSPMAENDVTAAELRKAMKHASKKAAKKQVKKALAVAFADESPLMKRIASLSTKEEVEAGLKKAVASAVATIVAAVTAEGDTPENLKKAADSAIRLVPDDEGKTGEDQSPEAKELRKTIETATAQLRKIAGKGTAAGDRPLAFADAL